MKKIGLIVEPFFLRRHVGVRNYLCSLAELLRQIGQVDLISYFRTRAEGRIQWWRGWPRDVSVLANNGLASDHCLRGAPREVASQYLDYRYENDCKSDDHDTGLYNIQLGPDLSHEDYDILIVTAPWLVQFEQRLPARQVLGMVYDIIPNLYCLTSTNKPLAFASEHERGISYFRDHCDGVLPISDAVGADLIRYFQVPRECVHVLPPLLRMSHFPTANSPIDRHGTVTLASPFDLRKGLTEMPSLLNEAREEIHRLRIYGGVRCAKNDVLHFFEKLAVRSVEWYPAATSQRVCEIFRSACVLLFPSFEEGLGLPILEAQICGCPVIARDKAPMNQLVLPQGHILTGDLAVDSTAMRSYLTRPQDHDLLEREARDKFSNAHVLQVFEDVLMGSQNRLRCVA